MATTKSKNNTITSMFSQAYVNRDMARQQQGLFTSTYSDWIIIMNLSFRQATNSTTIAMFRMYRPHTGPLFYRSHTGLRDAIIWTYYSRIEEVSRLLKMALSKIHISCDLWTFTPFCHCWVLLRIFWIVRTMNGLSCWFYHGKARRSKCGRQSLRGNLQIWTRGEAELLCWGQCP